MVDVFDTHKFLFSLNYENEISGIEVFFIDNKGKEKRIKVKNIKIGNSPISCTFIDVNEIKYRVPFLKIRKILDKKGKLIWDNTDNDLSNVKTISGF